MAYVWVVEEPTYAVFSTEKAARQYIEKMCANDPECAVSLAKFEIDNEDERTNHEELGEYGGGWKPDPTPLADDPRRIILHDKLT